MAIGGFSNLGVLFPFHLKLRMRHIENPMFHRTRGGEATTFSPNSKNGDCFLDRRRRYFEVVTKGLGHCDSCKEEFRESQLHTLLFGIHSSKVALAKIWNSVTISVDAQAGLRVWSLGGKGGLIPSTLEDRVVVHHVRCWLRGPHFDP